ncbi:MAG: cysteine desulfurase NifS [Bacillota bacterium]
MRVYLDNSATTNLDKEVLQKMLPYFTDIAGNASSLHGYGREALKAVDSARETIAEILGAKPHEIYFTSGGTESDNWALKGAVQASKNKKKHIITSVIEHPAILETCHELAMNGVAVTYVGVNKDGQVDVEEIKNAVTDDTILVSIMMANNEMGAVQPIAEIGKFCAEEGIYFHTDAVQAIDSQKIDVNAMHIDMLSLSAHKFHGPKGIGVLYVRSGVRIARQMAGGHQERAQRAGTTNTPLIVGVAEAMKISAQNREEYCTKVGQLSTYLMDRILAEVPHSTLNGGTANRLPNNVNISFEYVEGESILMLLDMDGIAVSSGSACSSGSLEPSHVMLAMGVKEELAHSSIRFSLGRETTKEELDYTVEKLKETIARLRAMSPLYNG